MLVASLGVAAVSYVACGGGATVANLMAPPQDASADVPPDARMEAVVANLMAPPDGFGAGDVNDAQADRDGRDGRDGPTDRVLLFDVVANLVPTPR